eukprot:190857-Chlamydomonas_euryale.AAC.1
MRPRQQVAAAAPPERRARGRLLPTSASKNRIRRPRVRIDVGRRRAAVAAAAVVEPRARRPSRRRLLVDGAERDLSRRRHSAAAACVNTAPCVVAFGEGRQDVGLSARGGRGGSGGGTAPIQGGARLAAAGAKLENLCGQECGAAARNIQQG